MGERLAGSLLAARYSTRGIRWVTCMLQMLGPLPSTPPALAGVRGALMMLINSLASEVLSVQPQAQVGDRDSFEKHFLTTRSPTVYRR